MKTAHKIAAKDSCNYALNQGASNETNIKITPEIAELFGSIPKPNESFDVSFSIEKGDFLRSHCQIMGDLPLYNNKGSLILFSEQLFKEKANAIFEFFGSEETKEIQATLSKPINHSLCLNFGPSKFKIRDFLVEDRSDLIFKEINGKIKLSIKYENKSRQSENTQNVNSIQDSEHKDFVPLQKIIYGAPGTGKSYSINRIIGEDAGMTEKDSDGKYIIPNDILIRTTFHPDYDYAQFVGCYKPIKATNGDLTYEFKPQAFTKAYERAYKNPGQKYYLVIEEINRGYCAQIFGDIFQLLDRNKEGVSEYGIEPDEDLKNYLTDHCSQGLIDGAMKLPNNLSIIATMNTSDQSLFPMDSAFKRRWDWVYEPIDYKKAKNFYVEVGGTVYNWGILINCLNKKIYEALENADKQIGNWFLKFTEDYKSNKECLAKEDAFVNKVLFYLWSDVYKDAEDKGIFLKYTFDSLFNEDKKVESSKVETIMKAILKDGDKDYYDEATKDQTSNNGSLPADAAVQPAETQPVGTEDSQEEGTQQ